MTDDKLQVLAAVQRNARAAEKRLNATEAEMRFAYDIASGIYTLDMIPSSMDVSKILELVDHYIAERSFLDKDSFDSIRRTQNSSVSNADEAPYLTRTSAASVVGHDLSAEHPVFGSPENDSTPSLFRRFLSWVPAIVVLIFFILLCVYVYDPSILSPAGASDPSEASNPSDSSSHAVNYKTSYVGDVNSNFIHRTTCRHAENILEKNRVYYESVADAMSDRRVRCSECLSTASSASPSEGDKLIPTSSLIPITPPQNGYILFEDSSYRIAPLTIKTNGSGYYMVRLRDHYSKKEVLTFFIHGGSEVTIDVPLGEFDLSYSSGENWYGKFAQFGDSAYCAKANEIFEFYEEGDQVIGWSVTLYTVAGGDLDFDEIPADQF